MSLFFFNDIINLYVIKFIFTTHQLTLWVDSSDEKNIGKKFWLKSLPKGDHLHED